MKIDFERFLEASEGRWLSNRIYLFGESTTPEQIKTDFRLTRFSAGASIFGESPYPDYPGFEIMWSSFNVTKDKPSTHGTMICQYSTTGDSGILYRNRGYMNESPVRELTK